MDDQRELMDYIRKKKSEDEAPAYRPSVSTPDQRNTRALIAGATPLLVGVLSGYTGDATEIASKALLSEDQRALDEDKSLMSYLNKKALKGSDGGSDQKPQQVRLDDGSLGYFKGGKYYKPSGEEIPAPKFYTETPEIVAKKTGAREEVLKKYGKGTSLTKHPYTGEVMAVDKSNLSSKPVFQAPESARGANPEQMKLVDKSVEKFNTDMKKNDEAIRDLESASHNLGTGQLGDKIALMKIVKQVEQRLSDQDRKFYLGNISTFRSLRERLQSEKDGKLPPRVIEDVKKMLAQTLASAKKYRDDARSVRIDQLSGRGIDRNYLSERFGLSSPANKESSISEEDKLSAEEEAIYKKFPHLREGK